MKKEIFYLTMMFLLFFTVSYTYSIFKNTIVGSLTANINNWSFKANVTNGVVYNDGYKVKLNGTSGTINVNLNTIGGNKTVDYSIELIGDNSIKYYEDSDYKKLINNNIYNNAISNNTSKTTTIYYKSDKSLNTDIVVKIKASIYAYVYGIKRDNNSSSSVCERIKDSVGLVANAVKPDNINPRNDFDNIYPWSDIKSYNYNSTTKEITAWYGDSNFKFDGSNGEVLTYIPGFYYKREVINGVDYQYISKTKQDGFSYSEPFSVGRYKISGGPEAEHENSSSSETSTPFEAKSKSGVYPSAYATISTFRESARKLGSEFSLMDYHYFVIQLLYLVEYADYDSQSKLGSGNVSRIRRLPLPDEQYTPTYGAIVMGGTNELGMKSGVLVDDEKHSMIYRGIEDIYGNIAEFVDGINVKDYQAYINYDYTTYETNVFGGKYQALSYINRDNSQIPLLGYDSNNQLIDFPIDEENSNQFVVNDLYYPVRGSAIFAIGGHSASHEHAGLWYYSSPSPDSGGGNTGSRLIRHHN